MISFISEKEVRIYMNEFLTWRMIPVHRTSTVELVVISLILFVIVYAFIWWIAQTVSGIIRLFFTIHEWELDYIDDEIYLEEHPECEICKSQELFTPACCTLRNGSVITKAVCRRHYKDPEFRYNVTIQYVGGKT